MTTVAQVRLWGTTIGAVALGDREEVASFEYAGGFAGSGIEVAPLVMPLSRRVYRFPALSRATFHGLPGMLADSLPDRFGNALIDTWLARQGRRPESFNAVERLCYTGSRGMGALEFSPVLGPKASQTEQLDVARLVELAATVLGQREELALSLDTHDSAGALRQILQVGTSAGGARAKAVIAWDPSSGEVRSGQLAAPPGFEHWLIKFDGVRGNGDRELADPAGFGAIEYVYYQMATSAGIEMAPCRLFEENGRRHFMTRRFDRPKGGDKLHMQSLGGVAHFDFNDAGAHSYEQAFAVARQLRLGADALEQLVRRMVFNLVARNQDDHVKNVAFLMNRSGTWSLAPAFDITFSYQPGGAWTGMHQMSVNGKRDSFTWADIRSAAANAGLVRGRLETIASDVHMAVENWPELAAKAGVNAARSEAIRATHRRELRPG